MSQLEYRVNAEDQISSVALSFAAIAVVSWRYLFAGPLVFSIVITVCLAVAAWVSAKRVGP